MDKVRGFMCGLTIGCLSLLMPSEAKAQVVMDSDLDKQPVVYPHFLPFLGKKLAEKGVELPLPVGLNVGYVFTDQGFDVSDLILGFGDQDPVNVDSFLSTEDNRVIAHGINLRFDVWVLPFLNVYYMANFIMDGDTVVNIKTPVEAEANVKFTGVSNGVGTTVAGGVKGWWLSGDFNWSWVNTNLLDDAALVQVIGVRTGANIDLKKQSRSIGFWGGFMHQKFGGDNAGSGPINEFLPPIDWDEAREGCELQDNPTLCAAVVAGLSNADLGTTNLSYSLQKAPSDPFAPLVGIQYQHDRNWYFRGELSFWNKWQVVIMANYRFGFRLGIPKNPDKEAALRAAGR